MSDSLRPAHRTVASSCVLRPGAPGVERLEPRTLLTTAIDIAPRANYSAVSMNGAGDFVAAWTDPQTDTLYARRFDSGGAPRTDALVVGSGLSGNVSQPAIDVALNDAGGFVVAWTDAHRDVRAREFDASDAPRGDAVVVNPVPTGQYPTASVGIDADGDFVVAWMADEAQRSPPSASYVRVFDAAGNPRSDAQRANPPATGGAHPDVAVEPDGDFVVAWWTGAQLGPTGEVMARRYDAAGAARGDAFRVNESAAGFEGYPAVAAAPEGSFVVAWQTTLINQSGSDVYVRRFGPDGAPLGGDVRANADDSFEEVSPDVALSPDGRFVVEWLTTVLTGTLGGVFVRRFAADGSPDGGDTRVAPSTTVGVGVATDAAGDTVVVSRGETRKSPGLYARLFHGAPVAEVGARGMFYYSSAYGTFLMAPDAAAATDKSPLMPGGTPSFDNVSSYSRGINGVTVEVWGLPAPKPTDISAADFTFETADAAAPSVWRPALPPVQLTESAGTGSRNADRIELRWREADAVHNGWLRVTVLPTPRTGIIAPEVFLFGNLVGETGPAPGGSATSPDVFTVDARDIARTRDRVVTSPVPGGATNRYDINHDGKINALDVLLARQNQHHALPPPPPERLPPPAPAFPRPDHPTWPVRRRLAYFADDLSPTSIP